MLIQISDDQIRQEFSPFGQIIEIRRPQNLAKKKPSQFAFVYYDSSEAIQAAILAMDGKELWDTHITAGDGDIQDSYFTQDTGKRYELMTTMTIFDIKFHFRIYYQ